MMNLKKDEDNDKNPGIMENVKNFGRTPLFRQMLVALGPIAITGVLGATEGYSAVLLPQLQDPNSTIPIDTQLSSWIASMSALPMAGGCLIGGYLMEKIGRRAIHIWSCLPLTLGWFLIAAAANSNHILAGRFLTGVSDGLLGPPTGVYIAETCSPQIRGVLIMATCVAITSGVLMGHTLGTFFSWRTTAWICGLASIPFAVLLFFVPESPTFLAKVGKMEEAKKAFYWCRGESKESQKELAELLERRRELDCAPKLSTLEQLACFSKPEFWKPTIFISVLFFTAQLSGNNAVASYTIKIIEECNLGDDSVDEYFAMVTMDVFRVVASIISCILVKKMYRRSLSMLSGYGVVIVLFLLCCYLYMVPRFGFHSPILLLVLLVLYVCFISVGLVPLSWTMMGEIFPLAYRGLGTAITSLVCYVFLYLVVLTFPYLLSFFGSISDVFMFYAICTLFGSIFLSVFLPETKDKPLYLIEDHFKSKKNTKIKNQELDCTEYI